MRGKRMWHTLRLWTIRSSVKRAEYCAKHHIFRSIGKNCTLMDRKVPLYAELISIGDNVRIASDVAIMTHDITHTMLNTYMSEQGSDVRFSEKVGCIEIGNNVFIGANSGILGDVRIGNNVIIGAFSLVNKDIPDNSVAAGVPARVIGTFDDFVAKRLEETKYPDEMKPYRQEVSPELVEWCWAQHEQKRSK